MIYWAGSGLLIGWIVARWLRGSRLGAPMLIIVALALLLVAAAHRFEADVLLSCLAFWIAAQCAWFLAGLVADAGRRRETGAEQAESPLG